MTSTDICPRTGRGLLFGLCVLSILFSLAALPSYGQYVHQLSYNGSSWTDQNLGGAAVETNGTGIAAFNTTPNDQTHVYYSSPVAYAIDDAHQLFFNGFNWADQDLTLLTGAPGQFQLVQPKRRLFGRELSICVLHHRRRSTPDAL